MAFAFVEASVVVYLRHLLGVSFSEISKKQVLLLLPGIAFLQPDTALKVIQDSALLNVEMIREAFTLVMLVSVATLAGKKIREQIAYFLLAFGIWDIFYYVFLKLTIGWPKSFSDLDIFFLLPTPWGRTRLCTSVDFFSISYRVIYIPLEKSGMNHSTPINSDPKKINIGFICSKCWKWFLNLTRSVANMILLVYR